MYTCVYTSVLCTYHCFLFSDDSTNGTYINWLYDLYSPTTTGSSGMNARSVCVCVHYFILYKQYL